MTKPLMVHVAGQLVPQDRAAVSVFDAGFQSGDAIWEGLRVYNGRVFRLERHLDRLEHSAHSLRLALPGGGNLSKQHSARLSPPTTCQTMPTSVSW